MLTILVFGVEPLGEVLLWAGMFTGLLEPQFSRLQVFLCLHEVDENEGLPNKLECL